MKTVLITGADGFLGRYLSTALRARGYSIHGMVRCAPDSKPDWIDHVWKAELADERAVQDAVMGAGAHYVVHLAAISNVAHGDVGEIYKTNIIGTRYLLSALAECEGDLKAVLIASSGNIYGAKVSGVVPETTVPEPANDYGVSKLACEHMARLFSNKLPTIIARPFNYTGVGQSPDFLIPKIISHFAQRATRIELGNIKVARDFSDVRDVAEIYCRLLENEASIGKTVNICSGEAIALETVIASASTLSQHVMQIDINRSLIRENEVPYLCGDRALLDVLTGCLERQSLNDTLKWMLDEAQSR